MELDIEKIAMSFGLIITNYVKVRSVYMCTTDKGRRSFKETKTNKDKLLFQYYAREHLYKNGFTNIDRFELNIETGMPYYEEAGKLYIMSYWIEGRECELENPFEMRLAITSLAKLHIASRNFTLPEGVTGKDDLGRIPGIYEKRRNELVRYKKKIDKIISRDKFDEVYIQNADYFIGCADSAISILKDSKYDELVDNTRAEKSFCHHDYAFHNIIIDDDNNLNVIDFEYSSYEIKIYDVANIIKRHMRKCCWDINEAKKIIDIYNETLDITTDELVVLKAILIFPQKFWRITNRYYNSKKMWSNDNFLEKLLVEADHIKFHQKFIEEYDNTFLIN